MGLDVTFKNAINGPIDAVRVPARIIVASNAAGYGAHGYTERWRYTVPAGKRALVKILYFYVDQTAANEDIGEKVLYTPAGGATVHIARAMSLATQYVSPTFTPDMVMLAGDALTCETKNNVAIVYTEECTAIIEEYDI